MKTYLLYEIANSHAGSIDYINRLINQIPKEKNSGIKFQIFKYDQLALPDYEWYRVYVELFIEKNKWKRVITETKKKGFEVWIDIFDDYSIEVLKENLTKVSGIKMQSSVLNNLKVLKSLSEVLRDTKLKIILNIAGRSRENIKEILQDFKTNYFDNEIIVQAGFQAYPTKPQDLLLNKIGILKAELPNHEISYADHVDGNSPLAIVVPAYSVLAGVNHIEKHVCLDRKNTKYDYQSAIEPAECYKLISKIKEMEKISGSRFIAEKEMNYLNTTIEKPIASADIRARDVVNFGNFDFRRTDQKGLTVAGLKTLMKKKYVIRKDIKNGSTLTPGDLRKARIGVVIACRMKSTRLKHKAILPIGKFNSIERCIINAKKIKSADEIILATSTLAEDQVLKKYALKHEIKFFAGDPDDVIMRYLGAAKKYNLDVIVRVTGDCPIVAYEMADFLVNRHFERGNDYTGPKEFAVGQNSEVYTVNTLKKVIEYLGDARHSEYMTWYMLTNKDIFQVDMAELPKDWIRGYRLTLDVQEDLDMFIALFEKLGNKEISIKNVFKVLDANPQIHNLNDAMTLKYRSDQKLIDMLNKETKIHLS